MKHSAEITIKHLDLLPESAERSLHKLRMIRISERCYVGDEPDETEANNEIVAAAEFCHA